MNITELSTKELLETAATLGQQSLAEFRTRGPAPIRSEQAKEDRARGDLIEALVGEARTRDDYETAQETREFERRAVTELSDNRAVNVETRNEKPVAVTQVNEPSDRELEVAYRTNLGANWNPERRTSLSAANEELTQEFRDVVKGKSLAPIDIPIGSRSYYQPGAEKRDLLKTGGTGTQSFAVSVYDKIVEHMVESSAVLKAGATVINTANGEDLIVPKTTGLATSAIFGEGASITESDPTLGQTVLKAFKYGTYFEVSRELAEDGHTDLLDVLARLAGESLGQAFGNDLINGVGTTAPRGILLDAGLGKNAVTGTGTSFGTQGTANQGTDLLWDTYGALAEPYANAPNLAWLMRNATLTALKKLKDTTGQPVANSLPGSMYVDPFMPAMANLAKSVVVGDFSRYVVRFVGGVRFERSDHFKFQNDLVAFKATVRLDAATVDNNAFKYFANAT